jgi:tungstate transport system ATP-binding protein
MTELYSLRDIEKRYGVRTVLRVPELAIHAGECLGIIGPSGAGKTTLLRLLAFLDTPSAGVLGYRGQEYGNRVPLSVRREITMVFQRPLLLDRPVIDNVAYGLQLRGQRDDGRVAAVIDELGLAPIARQPAPSLSAGEMQRVAMARALVIQPKVLLLDEPTANLDPDNVAILECAIRYARRSLGTTVVMVTHNLHQVRRLTTSVVGILDGQLVEHGPIDLVLNGASDRRLRDFVSGGMVY